MNHIILICGSTRPEVAETAEKFRQAGDTVIWLKSMLDALNGGAEKALSQIAKDYGRIDLLVFSPEHKLTGDDGITSGKKHDYQAVYDAYETNVWVYRQLVDGAKPLMRESRLRRIAVLTEDGSSIRLCRETADYAYHMSLAAVNMATRLFFNQLRKEGFTFRIFACEADRQGGYSAYDYICQNFCYDPKEPYTHSDENRLVMRNGYLEELPF